MLTCKWLLKSETVEVEVIVPQQGEPDSHDAATLLFCHAAWLHAACTLLKLLEECGYTTLLTAYSELVCLREL